MNTSNESDGASKPKEPRLILIPEGPFQMGTSQEQMDLLAREDALAARWRNKGFFDRERPLQVLSLAAYAIAQCPITVAQFREFINADSYHRRVFWTDDGWEWRQSGRTRPDYWDLPVWSGRESLPVVGISWYEAIAYCRWLSLETGRPYRLPTEAEWEKAARGTDARLYPWGDVFDSSRAHCRVSGISRTSLVGQFSPSGDSPFGCIDMAGNVAEWTSSKFRAYPYDANDGRETLDGLEARVIRGGSWHSPPLRLRAAARGMNDPWFSDHDVGFRLAMNTS